MPWEGAQSATACSPPPSGRGRGEGQLEAGRALAVPMLPDADVKTALERSGRTNAISHDPLLVGDLTLVPNLTVLPIRNTSSGGSPRQIRLISHAMKASGCQDA
jgi:hypothetical protein